MTRTEKWIAALSITAILITAAFFSESFRNVYERIVFLAHPSAELANMYGSRHFNSGDPSAYDIRLAEEYFHKAMFLDPYNAEAYHQVARIAFLRGDFTHALELIDRSLEVGKPPITSSYYMRGLILGFMERYDESAAAYKVYIASDPTNWAATNDLAWVLLKAKRYEETIDAIDKVLPLWPENPWILNSKATALYELKRYDEAYDAVKKADDAVQKLTEKEWLVAYPGNDPLIAKEGLQAFREAVTENMHTISLASENDR